MPSMYKLSLQLALAERTYRHICTYYRIAYRTDAREVFDIGSSSTPRSLLKERSTTSLPWVDWINMCLDMKELECTSESLLGVISA
jgi:hypothetical protein